MREVQAREGQQAVGGRQRDASRVAQHHALQHLVGRAQPRAAQQRAQPVRRHAPRARAAAAPRRLRLHRALHTHTHTAVSAPGRERERGRRDPARTFQNASRASSGGRRRSGTRPVAAGSRSASSARHSSAPRAPSPPRLRAQPRSAAASASPSTCGHESSSLIRHDPATPSGILTIRVPLRSHSFS